MKCNASDSSEEHTIGIEGCDISDGGESGPESGAESNATSTYSDLDEIEVITNQENTSDVGQQAAMEQVNDSGPSETNQFNVPILKLIIQAT